MVPGEVGRRIAAALGITGTMIAFKGRPGGGPPASTNVAQQLPNQNLNIHQSCEPIKAS